MKCRFCDWTTAQHIMTQWDGVQDTAHVEALRQHTRWTHKSAARAINKMNGRSLSTLIAVKADLERDEWDVDAPVIPYYSTPVQSAKARIRRLRNRGTRAATV